MMMMMTVKYQEMDAEGFLHHHFYFLRHFKDIDRRAKTVIQSFHLSSGNWISLLHVQQTFPPRSRHSKSDQVHPAAGELLPRRHQLVFQMDR